MNKNLNKTELDGVRASTTPITAQNPAVSRGDLPTQYFTNNNNTLELLYPIKIISGNNSLTMAASGTTFVRTTPRIESILLKFTGVSNGWINKDAGNQIYWYINNVNSGPLETNTSNSVILPADYITNSELKFYLLWSANANVMAGKSSTYKVGYGIHRIGSVPVTLIDSDDIVIDSPHTKDILLETLLLTSTPVDARAGDMLQVVLKSIFSDTTFYRSFYGVRVDYQSSK